MASKLQDENIILKVEGMRQSSTLHLLIVIYIPCLHGPIELSNKRARKINFRLVIGELFPITICPFCCALFLQCMFRGNFFYTTTWMSFHGEEVCRCSKKDDVHVSASWSVSRFVEKTIRHTIMPAAPGAGNAICTVTHGYMHSKARL